MPLGCFRQVAEGFQRLLEMIHRFRHGPTLTRPLGCRAPGDQRGVVQPGGEIVLRQQFRLPFGGVWMARADRLGDAGMQRPPPFAQQHGIGRVPDQRVLEHIDRVGRPVSHEHQPGFDQPAQRLPHDGFGVFTDRGEQLMGELPPDRGPDQRQFTHHRWRTQPRQQRSRQRIRNINRDRSAHQLIMGVALDQPPAFQHGLGHLLDEQRHAVRPRHDVGCHARRQCLALGDTLDQRRRVCLIEPVERQRRDVGSVGPGGLELRTAGENRHHPAVRRGLHDHLDQLA